MRSSLLFVVSFMIGLLLLSSHEGNVTRGNDFFQVKGSATNQMSKCSKNDISVAQGPAGTLPGGISQYLVEITNTNPRVPIADIHLNFKDFSSAILVSPEIFRRMAMDDCLVNDGRALAPGAALSFRYANTKQHPLPVVSAPC